MLYALTNLYFKLYFFILTYTYIFRSLLMYHWHACFCDFFFWQFESAWEIKSQIQIQIQKMILLFASALISPISLCQIQIQKTTLLFVDFFYFSVEPVSIHYSLSTSCEKKLE